MLVLNLFSLAGVPGLVENSLKKKSMERLNENIYKDLEELCIRR